jgi:hypothetical protein
MKNRPSKYTADEIFLAALFAITGTACFALGVWVA